MFSYFATWRQVMLGARLPPSCRSNGIEHFGFYHETKHGRGAGAQRLADS